MLNINIKPGITGEQKLLVEPKHTASSYGSGDVNVLATPAMIALMELTARISVESLLPPGHTTVGTEVGVKHLRATPTGHILRCESKVIEVTGSKLQFEVQVWDDEILVGHGTHTRAVVDLEKFMSKL
jgi:predicted thioesterase